MCSEEQGNRQEAPLARFENLFRAFLEDVSLVGSFAGRPHVALGRSYGRNNAVLGWGIEPLAELVDTLHSQLRNVSQKTIRQSVTRAAIRLFEEAVIRDDADPSNEAPLGSILPLLDTLPSDRIRSEVTDIWEHLARRIETLVALVPIDGIEFERVASLAVGDNITLYPSSGGPLRQLLEASSERQSREWVREAFEEVGCYSLIQTIEGDSQYVFEQAPREVENVVCILNLFLASCRAQRSGYERIHVVGQPMRFGDQVVMVARQSLERVVGGSWSLLATHPYRIDCDTLSQWQRNEFDEIIDCFGDPPPTSIQARIRRAVEWYSRGINGNTNEEQFVSLAIALESLLVGNEGRDRNASWGSITQRMAERAAFLLGDSVESRIDRARRVRDLYGDRSNVVHRGIAVSDQNLFELDDLVYDAILALARFSCRHEFESWEDFLNWENRQRYTAESEDPSGNGSQT